MKFIKSLLVPCFGLLLLGSSCVNQAVTADCPPEAKCTRELNPTVCSFNDKVFKGNNSCMARNEVKKYACDNKLAIEEDSIRCKSEMSLGGAKAVQSDTQPAGGTKPCEQETMMCTYEYKPATCTYNGKEYSGSNRCHAINMARKQACSQSVAFNEAQVSCKLTDSKKK